MFVVLYYDFCFYPNTNHTYIAMLIPFLLISCILQNHWSYIRPLMRTLITSMSPFLLGSLYSDSFSISYNGSRLGCPIVLPKVIMAARAILLFFVFTAGIANVFCTSYLSPSIAITIEHILRSFLWDHFSSSHGLCPVAWDTTTNSAGIGWT